MSRGADVARGARGLLTRPLPEPPAGLRRGPFRSGRLTGRLHDTAMAARLGLWLGVLFTVCMVTGLMSHWAQSADPWIPFPTRPVWLYGVTQGVHVLAGLAMVPVLLTKLFVVYPGLFAWPPARSLAHAVERLTLLVLVGGALLQVATGVMNIAQWYAFGFFFTVGHYWGAWITTGALLVHVGVKLGLAREALARPVETDQESRDAPAGGLSRRGLLTATAGAAAAVVVVTAGMAVRPLAGIALLAPRDPRVGPNGLPVNHTAKAADVMAQATDPGYRLQIDGTRRVALSLADLERLPQVTADLPITCVEGWSAGATWTGVRLRDLLALAGVEDPREVRVESLQRSGLYRASTLFPSAARDPLTLLALRVNGRPLHPDHGYPLRLIAPSRPGVLQTKWVARLVAR